jgi:ADP-ribosylglycohydrolase
MLARVEAVSSITHAHPRSLMACGLFGLIVRELLAGASPSGALSTALPLFSEYYAGRWPEEMPHFSAIGPSLEKAEVDRIDSGGYVIDTLTASLWCLLTSDSFSTCVLKAVNLGGDTDTTGCVAGGLAGVYYGLDAIPSEWLDALARKEDVEKLFNRFTS